MRFSTHSLYSDTHIPASNQPIYSSSSSTPSPSLLFSSTSTTSSPSPSPSILFSSTTSSHRYVGCHR